jgi:predicted CXXCH cytochrome family protein
MAALLTALLGCAPAFGGNWHYGSSAVCSDCHTQHNSAEGQPMRTDQVAAAAPVLLRRATPMELCLSCHDGGNPAAPDVIAPMTNTEAPAGEFPGGSESPGNAHDLNGTTPVVPPGGTVAMVVICTTCHDPHGNENYRNLRTDPTRSNQLPIDVTSAEKVIANGSNPSDVYAPSNLIYKSGISRWCLSCHSESAYGHSVDRPIFGSPMASYPTWASVTLPRVPVDSPLDDDIPSNDDRVTCLSCHKAHGSANDRTLIHADGSSLTSTCQECHDQ